MKRFSVLLIVIMFFMISCVSTSQVQQLSSRPSWINNNQEDESHLYYVIYAEGINRESAKKSACEYFIGEFSKDLSIEENREQYLDLLINTNMVKDYDIAIKKNYFEEQDSLVHGYFLFTVSKEKVETKKAENQKVFETQKEEVYNLITSSNANYRENYDFTAFEQLIDAYIIAREYSLPISYIDKSEIFDRCLRLLDSMKIETYDFNEKDLSCYFDFYRDTGFINPNILDGKIMVSYSAISPNLTPYKEYQSVTINDNTEKYFFKLTNSSILDEGIFVVKADISQQIFDLEQKGFIDAAEILEKHNISYIVPFGKNSSFENKIISLAVFENSTINKINDRDSLKPIQTFLEDQGAIVQVINPTSSDLESLMTLGADSDYLIIFKAEVSGKDVNKTANIKTTGSIEVYDTKSSNLIFDSSQYDSVGIDFNEENAIKNSFEKFVNKGIFYLYANF